VPERKAAKSHRSRLRTKINGQEVPLTSAALYSDMRLPIASISLQHPSYRENSLRLGDFDLRVREEMDDETKAHDSLR
jgi:hypothetical protein